jgi:ribosomal protein S18 acetylase RimI-like enzyme
MTVRPMQTGDVVAAATLSAAALDYDLEAAESERPGATRRWQDRLAHSLQTDPDGSFVAIADGLVIGVGQAIVRESLWVLSLLAVAPGTQSAGAGRALIAATFGYRGPGASAGDPSQPPTHGLIVASNDPRALRIYSSSGFELHPTLKAEGEVRTERLPAPDPEVREVGADALGRFENLVREVRGAAWTPELKVELAHGGQLLALGDRGVAMLSAGRGIWGLAARDEEAAKALLIAGLHRSAGQAQARVGWLTADQQWAIPLLIDAGLPLCAEGCLCVRGRPGTLHPFVPSGPYA